MPPKEQFTHDAVSSVEPASASWAVPQTELAQNDRVPPFQDLRVCDSCVGHVSMNSWPAIPGWTLSIGIKI